ncbi:exodeoxyribonuclease III [Zooshikella harenae]|uniref:Endonuclease/exonuclease/phosphatase family protein n=1 Tax=Zooshikella harenae TaxID=2827238 RepID=A0ABS5ZFF2_9GAMM|nr:exodeoxyribonuclease III [Zooshikella harenae]MBU2712806.1 endonuclease/exonuclease/phosphatase family protein [Zooshikella harenae]
MKIISFNLDGISRACEKGFFEWLKRQDADVICLQNIQENDAELTDQRIFPSDYLHYFFSAQPGQPGGVAIYSRTPPRAIMSGLNFPEANTFGAYIQADFDQLSIASIWVPECHQSTELKAAKYNFLDAYFLQLEKIQRKRREFILCGSWEIALDHHDVANIDNKHTLPGYLPEERNWMEDVQRQLGLVDAYRVVDRSNEQYTYWHNDEAFEQNIGWRFDYPLITPSLKSRVLNAGIYRGQHFSNHAPVITYYDWELPNEHF